MECVVPLTCLAALDVVEQRALRKHRTLGHTGGAGREEDGARAVGSEALESLARGNGKDVRD